MALTVEESLARRAGLRRRSILAAMAERARAVPPKRAVGRVTRLTGLMIESVGPRAKVGDRADVWTPEGPMPAEVVGFRDGRVLLMPLGDGRQIGPGARVVAHDRPFGVRVGPALLGRVLDGLGRPMDGGPPLAGEWREVERRPPSPLERPRIDRPLGTGVRAVDALCTVGRGQRVGIFAGSGVGKSTLLGMLARGTQADVTVIALVGERGREVRQFVDQTLGAEALARSVVVAATSDTPARVRIRAAHVATTVAEHFRDQGMDVLFIMDSVTRYAMALREVGLAVGEPPTTRGYTPSVFAELPRLMERAGRAAHGSITAFYTVLVDGDDMSEPIADAVRSILDGHLVLSRALAERGHYPPLDPRQSLSRLMPEVAGSDHLGHAAEVRRMWSLYEESADLIRIGAYAPGTSPELDRAVAARPQIEAFLRQGVGESAPYEETLRRLADLVGGWGA